jgi:ABC-type glycerol-3-phosphate transport system substrate-binding protein
VPNRPKQYDLNQQEETMLHQNVSRRTFLRALAGTVGVGIVTACMPSGPAAPAAGGEAEEAAAQPQAATEQGVFWGLQYDPHVETYKRLANLFQEKTGGVLVVEPQAWPLETKLIAALSAGTQPDVICIMGKVMIPLHIQKAVMPLKDVVYDAQGVVPEEAFFPEPIQAYSWAGDIYGVPVESNQAGSMVNVPVDDVEAAGLTDLYPPTNGEPWFESYESMWELAKALQVETDGAVERWGLSSKGWDNHSYLGIVRSLLAPDGTDWWDQEAEKFNLNSEAGVRAMELFAEIPVQMGIETELDQTQIDAALAGKVAISRGNGTPTVQGRDLGYNFKLCGAPPPVAGEAPLYVGEAGWGFAAPSNATHPDLAIGFLQMMCTQDGQREYAKIYSGLLAPAWKGLVGDFSHYVDSSDDSPNVGGARIMQEVLSPQTTYYGEAFGYPQEVDAIGAEICSLVRQGQLTAAEAAQQYQERCEAQYAQFLEDSKA